MTKKKVEKVEVKNIQNNVLRSAEVSGLYKLVGDEIPYDIKLNGWNIQNLGLLKVDDVVRYNNRSLLEVVKLETGNLIRFKMLSQKELKGRNGK
jgi:hypothetical protein